MKAKSSQRICLTICATLALSTSTALAQDTLGVGVNFIGAGSSVAANLSTGFWGQTNWNNVPGKEGDVIPLVDSNGAPSGISLIFRGSSTGNTAGLGTNPLTNAANYSRFTNLGAATGPQDGAADLWSGSLRHQNSFSFDPEPLTITLSGLTEKFDSYDIFLYFGNPNDQGDHYLVEFDTDADDFTADPWNGTTSEVTQAPASNFPFVGRQSTGGRSTGTMYGYNDNGTLMGGSLTNTVFDNGRPNDSFAVSSDYITNGEHLFTEDEIEIRFWDSNNNHNENVGGDGLDHNWGGADFNSARNWGPFADAGVVGFQIVGTPKIASLLADLTGNGFVDFEDLTVLLANWNKDVAEDGGNLVDPETTVVNFDDLTVLLADWTGPGPAGAPEAALGAEAVPEPSTFVLCAIALLSLLATRRRR